MVPRLTDSVSILGTGLAGLGHAGGLSEQDIIAEASKKAIDESGLELHEIDGIITSSLTSPWWTMRISEYLGITPKFSDTSMFGGSSFIADLEIARLAINEGLCENVLICYGATPRSVPSSSKINRMRAKLDPQPYEHPYKPFNPVSSYALAAKRHMFEFGTTREQMAEVAVSARKWAQLNPDAFRRSDLTVEDVLNSKMISDPLTALDCCLVTDGAAAFVVTSSKTAAKNSLVHIEVLGVGHNHTHRQISEMANLTTTPAVESGKQAFRQAQLAPDDIDFVEIYDAFTITPIMFLEDLGFCAKGEGGSFVSDGRTSPGGKLPMNTNGGGLSCVHPGMYSAFLVVEAVTQLRGNAGARQVLNPEIGLVHGNGGVFSSEATAILARV